MKTIVCQFLQLKNVVAKTGGTQGVILARALAFFFLIASANAGELLENWSDYHVTMWVGNSAYKDPARVPLFFQRLREMGVDAVTWGPGENLEMIRSNGFGFYGENIVNRGLCLKYNSKVKDWEKFLGNWNQEGRPEKDLIRDYCLKDPQWRSYAGKEMREAARQAREFKPFAYDIRDELSVTISANPFDYDFNPLNLGKFREWLRSEYRELKSLNEEWETRFGSWDEVKPFTTDEIKRRMSGGDARVDWEALKRLRFDPDAAAKSPARWNLAPWVDFRRFMDSSLTKALGEIRQAAHAEDPATAVGIEGVQMPSAWGGYDLWRLSGVLDWVEPYDICNAREILGSFMPGKPFMTTVFERENRPALRRLWHLLLEGDRGCIIWWSEDCFDWNSADYALTEKARALAPVLGEMKSPVAGVFREAQREYDPIAIQYSQASIQVDWLIESTVDGPSWIRRFSSFEAEHNRLGKVRNSWLKALQDLGYSPRFVSSEHIESGELAKGNYKAVVLPSSFALSEKERAAIQNFRGAVFADSTPAFDEHGKLKIIPEMAVPPGAVARLGAKGDSLRIDIASYMKHRLGPEPRQELTRWLAEWLPSPTVQIDAGARVRVHRYKTRNGGLLAFERNINYQMSEDLKQAGGNQELEKAITVPVKLPRPLFIRDLRTGKTLGPTAEFTVELDPWGPSLFATAEGESDLPK